MDIKYFTTFKAILEEGSFQNAADKLNYTQSTVSFHVQQIEQEFSIRLFEKIGRRMVLTKAGEDILPYVDSILSSCRQIENYGSKSDALVGSLRVSLPETLLVYMMQPVVKEFTDSAPNVDLSLSAHSCYTIANRILNGEADLGFYYDVEDDSPNIVLEECGNFKVLAVGSSQMEDIRGKDDLLRRRFIVSNDRESADREKAERFLKQNELRMEHILEISSFEAIKKCLINNVGFSYLPLFMVEDEIENGLLKKIDIGIEDDSITVLCAYHKNKWISSAMQLFMDIAKKHIKKAAL